MSQTYIDLCDKIKTQQYFRFLIFILMKSPLLHNTKQNNNLNKLNKHIYKAKL